MTYGGNWIHGRGACPRHLREVVVWEEFLLLGEEQDLEVEGGRKLNGHLLRQKCDVWEDLLVLAEILVFVVTSGTCPGGYLRINTLHSCSVSSYSEEELDIDKEPTIIWLCTTHTEWCLEKSRCDQIYAPIGCASQFTLRKLVRQTYQCDNLKSLGEWFRSYEDDNGSRLLRLEESWPLLHQSTVLRE